MTTAIAIPEHVQLVPWSAMDEERRVLLTQVCGGRLNTGQLQLLCEIGLRTGLDPFRKQIYGLELGGRFTVFTGIDGFRAVARRNGLAGIDAPVFEYIDPEQRIPSRCTITVYRHGPNGTREAYTATGLMREYMGTTPIWKAKPHLMLAKCVEALAHRMAFTETMAQVYERAEFPELDHTIGQRARRVSQQGPIDVTQPAIADAEVHASYSYDPDADPTDKDAP